MFSMSILSHIMTTNTNSTRFMSMNCSSKSSGSFSVNGNSSSAKFPVSSDDFPDLSILSHFLHPDSSSDLASHSPD